VNLADLSIKRPVFITAIAIILVAVGLLSMRSMPVDLFPDVTFPIVVVSTPYRGAGPEEVETLVSKVLEEEISTVSGIKKVSSTNNEGLSIVIAEFFLETDIKYAEQQVRDKVSSARIKLPDDVEASVIRRVDPSDQPILILSVKANMKESELFDLADNIIKPKIEQINQVGKVDIVGGREREIQVRLNRKKLKDYEISATQVVARINATGQNVPAGKSENTKNELAFRTLGEFKSVQDIANVVVSFFSNDVPVTVSDVGEVVDTVKDETTRGFINGQPALFLSVYRQSGANTIAVADAVKARVEKMKSEIQQISPGAEVKTVRDGAKPIRANVDDVKDAIFIGIFLTIIVVFFFLGSARSTFITGLALPNSLIGAFFLMSIAGFSINIMSLLALSLAVGLLIDDAIVVRENIFRHVEMGKPPIRAASEGTKEVLLAVIATTGAVIAVFGPIGFLKGMVGQFFKQFGLTVCFVMAISLFDAITMAPMLSAYFAGSHDGQKKGIFERFLEILQGVVKGSHVKRSRFRFVVSAASFPLIMILTLFSLVGSVLGPIIDTMLRKFNDGQTALENFYERILKWTIRHPIKVIVGGFAIFFVSLVAAGKVPKTFLPPQDAGEFSLTLDLPPGTSIQGMSEFSNKVEAVVRQNPEIESTIQMVGLNSKVNTASFTVILTPGEKRKLNTSEVKAKVREQLIPFKEGNPIVGDVNGVGTADRPFNVNIIGSNLKQLEEISTKIFQKLKTNPGLLDVDIGFRPGKPEFQVVPDQRAAERYGVLTTQIGSELRAQIEGVEAAVFREKGEEYDIRVRLRADERDLKEGFDQTFVPNVNGSLVRLRDVAKPVDTLGPSEITRLDRGRYIQIKADINPKGNGMGGVMADIDKMMKDEFKLPEGMRYSYSGQAENFKELLENMVIALFLGVLFIYLVLASLYESFVTPLTIMMVLPLAMCGAFFALLFTGQSLNIFSMIGCILLMGVATKNSILLVDYTNHLLGEGMSYADAVVRAGKIRLRPILMTSIALIAGMLPIAIGLNEASKQRTSMGIAIIGGVVSSTLLTLLVVPAAFSYMERFRRWSLALVKNIVGVEDEDWEEPSNGHGTAKKESSTTTASL
jgi:HAE1 family hydrophobic/amphiphilic exporter-1